MVKQVIAEAEAEAKRLAEQVALHPLTVLYTI